MGKFIKIAKQQDILPSKMKEYTVDGKSIAIANVEEDGSFLAFDGLCTHAHCPLAGGYLKGHTLTCYCHGAQFDILNGKVLAPPATQPLKVYNVKVEKGEIFVEI